jgi:hypothetical protein
MKMEVIDSSNGAYNRVEGSNLNKFYEHCCKVMNVTVVSRINMVVPAV